MTSSLDIRRFDTLGHADHGWLDARHHFSFAGYHNSERMGWGAIRVWNDDVIAPQAGFPLHPHHDMEIITYVRTGAITHTDSMGNEGRTEAGDVQVMSAGNGVHHAEHNFENEPTTLFQIWIEPSRKGGAPNWGAKPFPRGSRSGGLVTLASGFAGDEGALPIRADARIMAATLKPGESVDHMMASGRHGYLVLATGSAVIDGQTIEARDGVALIGGQTVTIRATARTEFVLVDAN